MGSLGTLSVESLPGRGYTEGLVCIRGGQENSRETRRKLIEQHSWCNQSSVLRGSRTFNTDSLIVLVFACLFVSLQFSLRNKWDVSPLS